MRILSFLILAGLISLSGIWLTHPHGTGFKISCNKCHSSKGWEFDKSIYSFDHGTTKMPLTGQHATAECRKCHVSLVFSEAKSECNACHTDIHQGTTGTDCMRCHNTSSWLVRNLTEIHQFSRFPLFGPHRTADCIKCHKSENPLRFDVPGVNCVDCHRDKYMATTQPNHTQAGFSEDCNRCHHINSFGWSGGGFNHTFFPLTQGHAIPKCNDCHTSGSYSNTPTDCYACHKSNYDATTNPGHVAANFPTTCTTCHTTAVGWKPASFNHNFFPLTLGHSGVSCVSCHVGGNYNNTPTDCYSCHKSDYEKTTNPSHLTLNFQTTCTLCHTTNPGWKPASYTQHDSQYFPIYSGRHRGTWTSCTDCHQTPSDYNQFTCLSCHAHNQTSMDNAHQGRSGYSYTSSACYNCHPTGRSEGK